MGTTASYFNRTCGVCGHRYEELWVDSDSEGTIRIPPTCPICHGDERRLSEAKARRKILGDTSKCGRCQRGQGLSWSTKQSASGVHENWCNECMREVDRGASPVIPGVSIDPDGFVIKKPWWKFW